jgi:flagellar biosynthetic protein FliR
MELTLPELAGDGLTSFLLVLARVGGLFVFAPVFSARMIPRPVKLACAAGLALALTPLATEGQPIAADGLGFAGMLLKEIMVGLALAFAMGALATAVQAAAGLLDAMIGFSLAAIIDPITNMQNAVIGQLYAVFTAMVLIATGGDHLIIQGFAASFRLVPLTEFPSLDTIVGLAMQGFAGIFLMGLEIIAPVMIALVIVDAAFALVSRAVPQMNVLVVGLPVKIVTGLVVISASLPFVATHLDGQLEEVVRSALRGLGM